jgi:hypothetical protein
LDWQAACTRQREHYPANNIVYGGAVLQKSITKSLKFSDLKKTDGPAAAPAARIFDFSRVKNVYSNIQACRAYILRAGRLGGAVT